VSELRYGVIGLNGIGHYHLRHALRHPDVTVTALVDVDKALVEKRAGDINARAFTDYRAMLAANVVDAVSIATPHHLHAPIGLACLEAGVHIFIEKPFAIRVSDADAMIAAAQANKCKIAVAYQYRTYQTPQRLKQIIESGALGNLTRILWTWLEFRPESYYQRADWRSSYAHAGGGLLMNQVSHDLDLICWLVGQPIAVSAMMGNQMHRAPIEDVVCVNMQFASGAFGSFQASINQPRGYSVRQIAGDRGILVLQDMQSLTQNVPDDILHGSYADPLAHLNVTLDGHHDQPAVRWRQHTARRQRLIDLPQRVWRRLRPQPPASGHGALFNDFISAIQTDTEPLVDGASAARTVELINAIVLAAIRGKEVTLPLDHQEYDELFRQLGDGSVAVPRFRGKV